MKGAELGNLILSTAIMVANLQQERPMQDLDMIFMDGDQTHAAQRLSIEELTKMLKFLYASDAHENPTTEFRQEVERVLQEQQNDHN